MVERDNESPPPPDGEDRQGPSIISTSGSSSANEKENEAPDMAILTGGPGLEVAAAAAANDDDTAHDLARRESTATTTTTSTDPGFLEDDETQYPTAWKLAVLTFGLAMSTFVVALDNTIIATAIPRITTVFNSLDDVGWYGSAYLLTTTSLQPSFGKIYTYFNIKHTYISALVIFEIGSVLCGAAVDSRMLIVGRAVAGAGAAALFSGGMTIIGFTVPLRRRPIYIGLLSSIFGVSSVIGPLMGGALTDRVSWRWW